MSDNLGLVIQVNYTASQENIDKAIKKLQEHVSTKKLHISFDADSIKGLDQISKAIAPAITQTNNLNTSMHNLGNSISNLNKESKINFFSGGKLTQTKEIKEMEDALGKLHKVTKTFSEGNETHRIVEDTTNYKKQRDEVDKLTNSMAKLREKSEIRIKTDANKSDLAQTNAINKTIEKENQDRIKAQQNASDLARRLMVEEENRRISVVTEAQTRIERAILGSNETISQQQNRMNSTNGHAYEQVWHRAFENRRNEEERLVQREQEMTERNIQRQQQLYAGLFNQSERTMQQQARLLNTRMQSALGLGTNISNNLTPESSRVLEHQLERYRNIIRQFQANNEVGITIRPEQLTQLQNLENRIRRFYETVRVGQNDSHGFNFTQYEQFTRLNPAITNATHAQQYYNTSLLEGHRLIASNIQQTEQYIRVTQQLRNGSQHLNLGVYIDRATGQMYQFNEALRDGMTRSWGLGEAMSTAATKAMVWSVVMGSMYGLLNVLQQIPQAIVEIDTRLVEMSKVMSSDTDFGALMKETAQSASTYGRTITETQNSLVEFGKQGFEAAQAVEMANTALLGANVTGLKTGEMAGYLTAAMAQFNIVAEDSVSVVNKINEVDNNFAVTSIGLAQSLSKAGESAQQYGATIDNLIGYTTAIQTATKESGNVIGNSLKTTISRTFSDDSEKMLNSVGIAIRDISGEVRTVDQIWSDLAVKFKTLSNEQRQQIGLTIGSRYHLTRFLALMDNWDIATKATTTSQQSLFSALEENRKHLASLESQINKVKSAGQELSYALGESGLKAVMSGVLGQITLFIKGLTALSEMSITGKVAMNAFVLIIGGLLAKTLSLIPALKNAALAMKAFTIATVTNPWIMAGAAILSVVGSIVMYNGRQKELKEEQEKLTQTIEKSAKAFNELNESMSKVGEPSLQNVNDAEAQIKKYDELIDKVNELNESKKKEKQYTYNEKGEYVFDKEGSLDSIYDPSELSDEMKDLATNLGINILQIKTWAEFVAEAKKKQDELNNSLVEGKKNSTEYQAERIKESQTQLDLAKNTSELVHEYKELSAMTEKNEQQTKRLAEVKNMLLAMFPEEFNNGKIIINSMEKEANKRLELAEAASIGSKQQLEANRRATQSAYETAVKNIALYQGEIDTLRALWEARTNNASIPETGNIGGLEILETSRIGGKIKAYESAKNSVNSLAKSIQAMDDVLNWKPASIASSDSGSSGGSKSSSSSSKNDPDYKDTTDALIAQINAESLLAKTKSESVKKELDQAKSSKDYQLQLEKTNALIQSQIDHINSLKTANSKITQTIHNIRSSSFSADGWLTLDGELTLKYYEQFNSSSKATQEEMQKEADKLSKLQKAWHDNSQAIDSVIESQKEFQATILTINLDIFNSAIEKTNSQLELSKARMSLLEESSSSYNSELNSQIALYRELISQQQAIIDFSNQQLLNDNLSIEAKQTLTKAIEDATISQINYQKTIQDTAKQLAMDVLEAQKSLAQAELDAEEKVLNAYIERKEAKIKGIQEEIEALDKKNELEEEQEERQKRLLAIEEAKQRLSNVLNEKNTRVLVGNQWEWQSSPTDVKDAQDDLKSLEEDYIDWEDDINLKHRKAALQAEIDYQQSLIDKKEESFNKQKTIFEEQWSNLDLMSKQLLELYGSNVDKAVEALRLKLAQLNSQMKEYIPNVPLPSNLSNGSGGGSSNWTKDWSTGPGTGNDIYGRPIPEEYMDKYGGSGNTSSPDDDKKYSSSSSGKQTVIGNSIDVGLAKAEAEKKGKSSNFNFKVVNDGDAGFAKSGDIVLGSEAVVKDKGSGTRAGGANRNETLEKFKKITGLDTGGLTPSWGDSGKLAFLHEKELVLNKIDTSNILKAVDITRNFMTNFKLPDLSNIKLPAMNNGVGGNGGITINNMTVVTPNVDNFKSQMSNLLRLTK